MGVSKSQQAAVNRYIKKNYDRLNLTIAKGTKTALETVAAQNGISVNEYVRQALKAKYKADTGKDIEL
ncbi:MAG: hypothetical protein IJG16_10985 [Clostridia bacterium]|nr:hypothetical protein [Clostridia bacterium]